MNLAHKILKAHLVHGELIPGKTLLGSGNHTPGAALNYVRESL